MIKTSVILLTLIFSPASVFGQDTLYHGFRCHNFRFEDHDARIVFPEKAEKGRHWIWRARFWGHEPQTEVALLKKGFHLVFINAPELCGNSEAVQLWNHFYEYLTATYQLNSKTVLEGFSRGGLYIYNWGSENPGKVACIYADAPVCDIRSWPGGKGRGTGSPADWTLHLKAYGLTEESADVFRGMPVFNASRLAEAHVPVLHVCGAADDVVPVEENTYALEKTFRQAGGDIRIILKEGIGHHPHSLADPAPIVRFILSNTAPELLDPSEPYESKMAISFRGSMVNSMIKFSREKSGRVAFLGGSITHNPGWRDMVADYIKQRFPGAQIDFINAGIPSLGSVPGAMRLTEDVLSKGKPDLLFVEAAVNDATNGVTPEMQVRGMEGIIAQARRSNPYMDIVMMHFADQDKMADYNNGKVPGVIMMHEKVAEHYGIPSIDLAREVNNRVLNGEFSWRDDFKNLHPSPFGQKLYFRTISHFLDDSWKQSTQVEMEQHRMPPAPVDPFSYVNGHFEPPGKAKILNGWTLVKNWKPAGKAQTREGFVNDEILEATQPGAMLEYRFKGKAVGIFVTSGPDAGIVEFSIDGSEFRKIDQFTQWSGSLHLPWMIILTDSLKEDRHILVLRTSAEKNPSSTGHVCRIHRFAVN